MKHRTVLTVIVTLLATYEIYSGRATGFQEDGSVRGNNAVPMLSQAPLQPARVDTRTLQTRLDSVLTRIVAEQRLPGATAAVFVNGQIVTVAAGFANRDTRKPMQPRDRMPAGSVGKTFVAAMAVALSLEGRLELDAPVSRWLGNESWFSRVPNASSLTMRLLLSHRSGIPNHVDFPEFVDAVRASMATKRPLPPLDAFKFVLDRPAAFAAGSGYLYSDTGYLLVGFVLERVLATKYEVELQRRFFSPLALTATSPINRRDLPGLVPGYLPYPNSLGMPDTTVDDTGQLVVDPSFEWTGGGLITTSGDLARWMAMLFQHDKLRPVSALMTRIPDAHARYGLGLSQRDGVDGPLWGHSGWFLGYRTEVAYSRAKSAGVAFQTNYAQADGGGAVDQLLSEIASPGR
jgi:D-alanyl-D-alanine carboxypeptidase